MEQEYIQTFEAFQNTKNIPDIFCVFVEQLKTIPAESLTPDVQNQVKNYFQDINKRIQEYDDQYKILLNELGVLCGANTKPPIAQRFFQSLLDFFRMAYSVYQDQPEKLQVFETILRQIKTLFQTGTLQFEGTPLEKALLLQLTRSAWILSHPPTSMEKVANQIGGRKKNKTRKQKHLSVA
jgi:hypothetical protein